MESWNACNIRRGGQVLSLTTINFSGGRQSFIIYPLLAGRNGTCEYNSSGVWIALRKQAECVETQACWESVESCVVDSRTVHFVVAHLFASMLSLLCQRLRKNPSVMTRNTEADFHVVGWHDCVDAFVGPSVTSHVIDVKALPLQNSSCFWPWWHISKDRKGIVWQKWKFCHLLTVMFFQTHVLLLFFHIVQFFEES